MADSTPDGLRKRDHYIMRVADRRARAELASIHLLSEIALLRCFRAHLQATVRYVSPLAYEIVARSGRSFDDALEDLRPGPAWLRRGSIKRQSGGLRTPLYGRLPPDVDQIFNPGLNWLSPAEGITTFRTRSHPEGYAGIRIVGRSVEAIATLGVSTLSTEAGLARLSIGNRLPETLALALIGKELGEIVDSELFAQRSYIVTGVINDRLPGAPTVLVFETGQAMRMMPWPELRSI